LRGGGCVSRASDAPLCVMDVLQKSVVVEIAPTGRRPHRANYKPGQSGNPAGKPKGTISRVHRTIKEAIETACAPGACHPEGLAGWLIERARGSVTDRQIFAGLVAKALPAQLQASVQHGGVVVQLGWLTSRGVGRNTLSSHSDITDAQVIDASGLLMHDHRVGDPTIVSDGPYADPPPPLNPAGGGQ
jgi:Family of unknown function (DUF5681)